jgi:cysteate synthase
LKCDRTYPEDDYICKCTNECYSVLRTEYSKKKLEIVDSCNGIWKYINWLPIKKVERGLLEKNSSFSLYKSKKLSEYLGLKNLIICMNVYPKMHTGSFKDIEAEVSLQRAIDSKESGKPLVLSSDGNNAISFIYYSDITKYPIVLFVTEDAKNKRIWSFKRKNPYTKLFCIKGDYYDAIKLAQTFGQIDGFLPEGGALNVGRRDGVGTIFLEAVRFLGHIPNHYFQALGSGPGAIAVYESALRLIEDGRYGKNLPKIHGSQNYPYVPMFEAWKEKSREIDRKYQIESAKKLIDQTHAHVLTNRYPAYSIKGGVYDVFTATAGEFYSVTNQELKKAQDLFEKLEGVSIVPESGVAVSSLIKAKEDETVNPDDSILINITGGGREEMQKERFKIESTMLSESKYNLKQISQGILK